MLDADEEEAAESYDRAMADALYQDHPRRVPANPPDGPVDQGGEELDLPFKES